MKDKSYSNSEMQKAIIEEVLPFKKYLTSVRKWNDFAKDDLPNSQTIIHYFGKWSYFKIKIGIKPEEEIETKKKEYIRIAKKYIGHFSKSASVWKTFAREHNLPSLTSYVSLFGSWSNAQLEAGINHENTIKLPFKYEREYLIQVAEENKEQFAHTAIWNDFSRQNNLPSQFAYINEFGSMLQAKREIGINEINTVMRYSKEYLVRIAKDNIEHFTTEKNWDRFAATNSLPRHRAYAHAFGTWRKSKKHILNKK
ncbi:hypothetical protein [Viridibacillus arvi]|uniref:hypothetical protein n=1 Tax=Viridibacillus arvi TaxID=263475 RepID=UPI0034CE5B89